MAIALFPLKNGETLAGNFGRYAELMDPKSVYNFSQSLYGFVSRRVALLPSGIEYLAEQTRDYWNLKAEDIVNDYTEFRYVTMMASTATREKILRGMLRPPGNTELVRRIIRLSGERTVALRYCEECLVEWIENRETPYWKIDHQLPGVYRCVKHFSTLRSVKKGFSQVNFFPGVKSLISDLDEQVLERMTPSEKRAIDGVAIRSVQQRVDGALCKPVGVFRHLLMEAGFLREDSKVRKDALISGWLDYFGLEYCHITNMTAVRIATWLQTLSECAPVRECRHPFMFIAGESFLDHRIKLPGSYLPGIQCNASTSPSETKTVPPVLGLHSCTGALHRGGDVLNSSPLKSGSWKIVCTCGITYLMSAAMPGVTAQLRPLSYGARYHGRFQELIAKGASVCRAAKELGLPRSTARNWVGRKNAGNGKKLPQREIRRLRGTWRRTVENASPERRITAAAKGDPSVYKALSKYDRDWLRSFNRGHRSPRPRVLYEPTVIEVREAWRGLLAIDPPIRASRSAILERTGFRRVRSPSQSFTAVLAEVVERRPAYCERVLSWLATMASEQRLGDCEEAIRVTGLRRRSFTSEQQERIREIERMVLPMAAPRANVSREVKHSA